MSESYFIFSNGELKRKDNVVRITALDGRFKDIKVEMTRDIYLFGEVSLNTKCLNYLATLKIPVHVFNYYGFYTGTFYPKETNVSGKLFVKQVENYTNNSKRTEIAQLIIDAASSNILRNLRYYQERGKDLEEIIEQKWNEQYENDRDMANDWAESAPFDKIAYEKSKNISSNELMKLVFETIYLADENGSFFDIQDIESEDGSESIQMLLKVFVSEGILYLVRRNEIETSEMSESEVAKKIIDIIS